ncbi:MAG: site-specific integrase [Bacteroidales bacterium]|nr:site-specific integrase [Bacteroidales bacterium]MCF8336419.1 site-specific integrase [Bacteroidales bacterium]
MAAREISNYVITPEKFLDEDEQKTLLKTCRERSELDLMKGRKTKPVRYMLVDLALYSGLRVMELAALTIGDINTTGKNPYLIVRSGKRKKQRFVYIESGLCSHLKNFISYKQKTLGQSIDKNAPLFAGRNGNHPPTITLMKSWEKAVETAGLSKKYSIHNARHTYATYLYKSTKDLLKVKKYLGHSNINMTLLYADLVPDDNESNIKRIEY